MNHKHREKDPEEIADDIAQLDFYAHCDWVIAMNVMEAAVVGAESEVDDLEVSRDSEVYRLRRDARTLVLRTHGRKVKGEGRAIGHSESEARPYCSTVTWIVDERDSLRRLILAWLS